TITKKPTPLICASRTIVIPLPYVRSRKLEASFFSCRLLRPLKSGTRARSSLNSGTGAHLTASTTRPLTGEQRHSQGVPSAPRFHGAMTSTPPPSRLAPARRRAHIVKLASVGAAAVGFGVV